VGKNCFLKRKMQILSNLFSRGNGCASICCKSVVKKCRIILFRKRLADKCCCERDSCCDVPLSCRPRKGGRTPALARAHGHRSAGVRPCKRGRQDEGTLRQKKGFPHSQEARMTVDFSRTVFRNMHHPTKRLPMPLRTFLFRPLDCRLPFPKTHVRKISLFVFLNEPVQ